MKPMSIEHEETVLETVIRLQDSLVSYATGGSFTDGEYKDLRRQLLSNRATSAKLPEYVRRYRDLSQFWQFIKHEYETYKERRQFLWDSFRPLIDDLEAHVASPAAIPIGKALEDFDPDQVHVIWQRAVSRIDTDPEGAITLARALLESTSWMGWTIPRTQTSGADGRDAEPRTRAARREGL
jgi:hypothetical protein